MARRNNAAIALFCVIAAFGMVGAAYAAVPLYRLFCQVTGFDGTVRRAEQVTQRVHIGETGLAYFKVTNTSDQPISGTAAYNVVPESAGPYFQKLQCFCFDAQVIQPGQTMEFPVQYFVAPELATDREADGIREITLSYTFYPTQGFDQRADTGLGGQG